MASRRWRSRPWTSRLWDMKARRRATPLWRLLGGHDPRVPCYAGGIDLDLPLDALLRQTDDNLARGFRAIKMKVGRPRLGEDVERVRAMREHLGADFPLMVDANMRWSADEAIRAARALAPASARLARGADHPRRRGRPRADRARWRPAHRHRREPPHAPRVLADDPHGRRVLSRARRDQLRRGHRLHEGGAPRRGLQPARHLARRPRRDGAPAGGGAQPLLSRSARLRSRPLHRGPDRDRRGPGHRPRAAGPRHALRLGRARPVRAT